MKRDENFYFKELNSIMHCDLERENSEILYFKLLILFQQSRWIYDSANNFIFKFCYVVNC